MVDFQLGKIYKIVSGDFAYIGSTCEQNLETRMTSHKNYFNRWTKDDSLRYITAFKVLENNDAAIVLLELYPCNTRHELHVRERFHIENNICVNKTIPTRNPQEYKKIWYEANKEKIKEKSRNYHHANKEDIHLKQKLYRDNYTDAQKARACEYTKKFIDKDRERHNKKRRERRMLKQKTCETLISNDNV